MTILSKDVHRGLTRVQVIARIFLTPRGRQIQSLFAKEPRVSVREATELGSELNTLITDAQQADTEAALARGDFGREPPARQQSATVFKSGDDFDKIMTAAMRGK